MIDNNVAVLLATGTLIVLNIFRDRQRAKNQAAKDAALAAQLRQQQAQLQQQHEWDVQDRREKNGVIVNAINQRTEAIRSDIKENTAVNEAALTASNNYNQKLLTIDQRLSNLLQGGPLSTADIGRLLIEMKANADSLETYAHNAVHRLNNLVMGMQAQIYMNEKREGE